MRNFQGFCTRRSLSMAAAVAVFGLAGSGLLNEPVAAADDARVIRVDRNFGADEPVAFVPDEFIVVLSAQARGQLVTDVDRAGAVKVNLPSVQDVVDRHNVTRLNRQFPGAKPQAANSKFQDITGYYKAKIGPGVNLDEAMAAFGRNPNIDHTEKIGIHPVYGCASGTAQSPNDTYYDNPPPTFDWPQWDLWDTEGIDADFAWTLEAGDPNVVVVAMDSGVRYFHADLGGPDPPGPADNTTNGNVWVNPFEIPGNGIDDEGNGRIDDVVGYDFVTGVTGCASGEDCSGVDNDPRDFNGHGTHTAGTMAAITNNSGGVAGIAGGFGDGTGGSVGNGSKVMCCRIGWSDPVGNGFVRMDFAAQAMAYVTDMKNRGVNVAAVNASWGSSNSGGIDAAVNNLLAADVMLIHAAGNGGTNSPDYLGNKAGVVNVAATTQTGARASFSDFGAWVDIAAPGVDIISTYHVSSDPANDYVALSDGTSMSAPHVAGVAALLESCDPTLSGPDKFNLMVDNTCLAASPDIGGILNAKLALDAAGCGTPCTGDPECDDELFCTGTETCNAGTCQSSGDPCGGGTVCNEATDSCDPLVCDNNGICDTGEDCNNCPADCISGTSSGAICGNNVCEAGDGEDCVSCADDCNGKQNGNPNGRFCCGDGDGQNPLPCSDGTCTGSGNTCTDVPTGGGASFCCGDTFCEGDEDSFNCAIDCGDPPVCGDGDCVGGEDECNCASDCCDFAPASETGSCSDGCDNDCDGLTDTADPDCACAGNKAACTVDGDCCSNNCKNNFCKGN